MIQILKIIVAIINKLHDLLIKFFSGFGLNYNDKQLHFIIIGVIGMFIYVIVDKLFKAMSKYNISILSFIYTFTVLIVIVFGIEIEQKVTSSGKMEFSDIMAGLWGFTAFFIIYLIIYNLICFLKKSKKTHTEKTKMNK